MVNLTISLSNETVQKLRKTVHERYGDKKGALSGLIEDSLREKLDEIDMASSPQSFKAMKGDRVIAEGESLDELATRLEKMNVNPRSVRIISSKKLALTVRTGLRRRKV
ncbi:MAG: ribbon-helix-helix domain-containing protein [Nitrososphaerales archaeon]